MENYISYIIAVLLINSSNYGDKVVEETAQRAVDRMMEMKKQAAEKDTISLIPLVLLKKLIVYETKRFYL